VTEVKLIKDKATGLSAGYGFIAFADPAAAAAALRSTAGRPLYGQPARVNWAFAKADRSRTAAHAHLFVGDLPAGMTDRSLRAAFVAGCGPACSDARVMWDHATGRGRGYGFVAFRTPADAAAAIETMHGAVLGGRRLRVGWASHRLPGLGGGGSEDGGGDGEGGGGGGDHAPPLRAAGSAPLPSSSDGPSAPAGSSGWRPGGSGGGDDSGGDDSGGVGSGGAPHHHAHAPSSHHAPPHHHVPFISLDPAVLSAASPGNTNVYVGALPPGTGEAEVAAAAAAFGPIVSVRAFAGAGFAFVEFGDHAAALAAIIGLSTGGWLDGRSLKVAWGRPPGIGGGGGGGRARGGGGRDGGGAPAALLPAAAAAQAALLQQYVALGLLPPQGGGGGGGGGDGPTEAALLHHLYSVGGGGPPPPPPPQ